MKDILIIVLLGVCAWILFEILSRFFVELSALRMVRKMLSDLRKGGGKKGKPVWTTTPGGPFVVTVTDDGIACEHPERKRESIRWDEVKEVRLVTTEAGPWLPDLWYLFVGEPGKGCSVPSEAEGFDQLWDVFKERFPGLDYAAIINAGTKNSQKTLWKKPAGP